MCWGMKPSVTAAEDDGRRREEGGRAGGRWGGCLTGRRAGRAGVW